MLLRVIRGTVRPGREAEFVDRLRARASGVSAPGLLAFMAGYRRVDGREEFISVNTWRTDADARRATGERERPILATLMVDIAEMRPAERYELLAPPYEGIVDVPGAVLRVTRATIRPGQRGPMLRWLADLVHSARGEQLALGWALGTRQTDRGEQAVAVSAWASPLVVEAVAEPGRTGTTLTAAADAFVTDVAVEHYQAIELGLAARSTDPYARRLVAARFGSLDAAVGARDALLAALPSARDVPMSLAPLGSPGGGAAPDEQLLVARVRVAEYATAERLIADAGGQIVLATMEPAAPR